MAVPLGLGYHTESPICSQPSSRNPFRCWSLQIAKTLSGGALLRQRLGGGNPIIFGIHFHK